MIKKSFKKQKNNYNKQKVVNIYSMYNHIGVDNKTDMLDISLQDQKLLFNQNQLKKLETNQYLEDINNENYKYIKDKFFLHEDDDKCKLLNLGSGLFSTISEIFSFYVGNPDIALGMMLNEATKDLIALGFCTIGMQRIDGKLQLVYEPAKNYRYQDGIDRISRLYQDDDKLLYVLVQQYNIGNIENKLYALSGTSLTSGKEVPLDTIPQTKDLEPIIETGLDRPALFVITDSEYSIIEKIKPLVYSVDRQVIMSHTQYLQNMESFVLFKNVKRPQKIIDQYNKVGRIDFSKIGRIINGDENAKVEFVNNTNSLIDKAIEESDNHIRRISAISTIPIEFLGLESKEGSVGQGSRTLRHGAFIKKIQYIRDLYNEIIYEFVELNKSDIAYSRPDIFAKTDNELVEELAIARQNKLISLVNAIKKYNKYSDEEAENELDLINNEGVLPVTDINEES